MGGPIAQRIGLSKKGFSIAARLAVYVLFALLPATVSAQDTVEGVWEAPAGERLILEPDGHFRLDLPETADVVRTGVWRRQGDRVHLTAAPAQRHPAFTIVSTGPFGVDAEAALQHALSAFAEKRTERMCPWLFESDVTASVPTIGAPRATASQAHESFTLARARAEAASAAGKLAAERPTRANRDAAVSAMAEFNAAWGRARDLYLSAGLKIPSRPEITVPTPCQSQVERPGEALFAIHLLPDDGSLQPYFTKVAVGLKQSTGTQWVPFSKDGWAFPTRDNVASAEGLHFSPLVGTSQTVPLQGFDAGARQITIRADTQELHEGAFDVWLRLGNDVLMADEGPSFRRTGAGASADQAAPSLVLASVGYDFGGRAPPHAGGTGDLCQPGAIAPAPLPGAAAPAPCTARSSLESRYVMITVTSPDGEPLRDGSAVRLARTDGSQAAAMIADGAAFFPIAAGAPVRQIAIKGYDTPLAVPEQWHTQRRFDVLASGED